MAAAPSCTWVDCPAVWGLSVIVSLGMDNDPPLGPPARQGTTHGRTFRPHHRVAVVVEPWDGQDPPADST